MDAFTALRLIAEAKLSPMTEADYEDHAGAGDEALIGEVEYEGKAYVIIVDEFGVEISRLAELGAFENYQFVLSSI